MRNGGDWTERGYEFNFDTGQVFRYGRELKAKMASGYKTLQYKNKKYLQHRVIFEEYYGWLPTNVDHINHDKSDNRLCNLRAATPSQNNCNRKRGELPLGIYKRRRKGRPGWWYEIVEGLPDPLVEGSHIKVWDQPGLGVEINIEAARQYLAEEDRNFFD